MRNKITYTRDEMLALNKPNASPPANRPPEFLNPNRYNPTLFTQHGSFSCAPPKLPHFHDEQDPGSSASPICVY